MMRHIKSTRIRVTVAVVATVALVVLWITFDMPIAILPVLLVTHWMPVFQKQEAAPLRAKRRMLVVAMLGVIVFVMVAGITVKFDFYAIPVVVVGILIVLFAAGISCIKFGVKRRRVV